MEVNNMNTKNLMTASCLFLGAVGLFTLFAPDTLLGFMDALPTKPLVVTVQLMGTLYFAFALLNWTAKDSAIGGIYARPVSLGNFAHFFVGTLLLAKYELSNRFSVSVSIVLIVYAIFASLFYWL